MEVRSMTRHRLMGLALLLAGVMLFPGRAITEPLDLKRGPIPEEELKEIKKPRGIKPLDLPIIKEFSVSPEITTVGEPVMIRWRVEPGPGGSPIKRVVINAFLVTIYDGRLSSGGRTFTPAGPGDAPLVLVAENQAGKSSSKSVPFEVISLDELREQLILKEISTTPSPVRGDKTPFSITVTILNKSPVKLNRMVIRVLQTDDPTAASGLVIADSPWTAINPGLHIYNDNIRYGFIPDDGRLLFVILFSRAHPEDIKVFPVSFSIRTEGTENIYTVGPR